MKASMASGQTGKIAAGAFLLVGAGGLAWWGVSGLLEKQAEAQALAERLGNPALAALLASPAGPTKLVRETAEIEALEKSARENNGAVPLRWSQGTQEATGEGQDWSKDPGRWKDHLVTVQSQLQKDASAKGVRLGEDFYLGLQAFRQKSPSAEEVPGLAVHLSVARRFIELLIRAREKAKEQYPTICGVQTLTGPGSVTEKPAEMVSGPPAGRPATAGGGPERKTFQLEIQCSPEVLYEYIRMLSTDDWLFIVKNLSVTNARQDFPLRSEIAKRFNSAEKSGDQAPDSAGRSAGADSSAQGRKLLEILAGNEALTASLEVDFVAWRNSGAGKGGAAAPAKSP